jgi:tRNA A37 N6-isopentenylltransferase MiaA
MDRRSASLALKRPGGRGKAVRFYRLSRVAIGYRELRAVLQGKMSLSGAREAIQQATRRYAKRQITWFRKEPGVRWFPGFGDDPGVEASIIEWLQAEGLEPQILV